jgi:hypothetical protein
MATGVSSKWSRSIEPDDLPSKLPNRVGSFYGIKVAEVVRPSFEI